MEMLVCVKRVPDSAENEIRINHNGSDIARDDLVYSVNEWDNYAVEEAIRIRDRVGGTVTVISVGDEDAEEVLRREMAMGADRGMLLSDEVFKTADGRVTANLLKKAVEKGRYDLILTGAQADTGAGQVGGMLAALLDLPYASLVNSIEVLDDGRLKVGREIEGGNIEMNLIELPCVLSIQTGINAPRYVGIRGIRKVASVDIPTYGASDLELAADQIQVRVRRRNYFVPAVGNGADMLVGSTDEIVEKLFEMLKAKGGIK